MKLELRLLTPEDVTQGYVDWMNNPVVVQYTEQRFSKHTMEDVIAFVASKQGSKDEYLYGIFADDRHVGNIKLGPIKHLHKVADISYLIGDPSAWGKGIATFAIGEVTRLAFEEHGLEKVTASVYDGNTGSSKALLRNGFQLEGTLRQQYIFEGKRIDATLYGRLKALRL